MGEMALCVKGKGITIYGGFGLYSCGRADGQCENKEGSWLQRLRLC
jgi:hypothetical protein